MDGVADGVDPKGLDGVDAPKAEEPNAGVEDPNPGLVNAGVF